METPAKHTATSEEGLNAGGAHAMKVEESLPLPPMPLPEDAGVVLPPKVQLPFAPLLGQAPRALQIERKRRE